MPSHLHVFPLPVGRKLFFQPYPSLLQSQTMSSSQATSCKFKYQNSIFTCRLYERKKKSIIFAAATYHLEIHESPILSSRKSSACMQHELSMPYPFPPVLDQRSSIAILSTIFLFSLRFLPPSPVQFRQSLPPHRKTLSNPELSHRSCISHHSLPSNSAYRSHV